MSSSITLRDTSAKWYKQRKRSSNADAVLINLLRYMKIPVTSLTATETLQNHPAYPSLVSLKDTLSQWKVQSIPLFLDIQELDEINYPAIAHTGMEGGHFILLIKKENGIIHFIDPASGWRSLPLDEFSKIWSGAVLLVKANDNSGEKNFRKNKIREWLSKARTPFITTVACLLITMLVGLYLGLGASNHSIERTWLPLFFTKIIGAVLSILLITNDLHENNGLINRICNLHKQINCKRVLQSKAATSGPFNISELGGFYFIGGIFTLALSVFTRDVASVIPIIAMLNLVSLPFTLFSIYYQGVVIKKWCLLCLGVLSVLWLEFILTFNNLSFSMHIEYTTLGILTWGFMLPLLIWIIFRQTYIKSNQADDLKKLLNRFRGNKNIFSILLNQQNKVEVGELTSDIIIGNPMATHTIVMVTNPDCNPCAQAHQEITSLISSISDKIKIVYRFASDSPVVRLIINTAIKEGNKKASLMLSQWYAMKDEKKFMTNVDLNGNTVNVNEIIGEHLAWCNNANIKQTPTILLNGFQIPDCYKISDLRYLIS
jgi:uncharacterized membrane protein